MDPTAYVALLQLLAKGASEAYKLGVEGWYKIKAGQDLSKEEMIAIHDAALKGNAESDLVDAERRAAA